MEGLLSIRSRPATWATAIVALVLALNLMGQRTAAQAGRATLTPSHQAAGLWLAARASTDEPVMSRNPEVALYADRPLVAFPNAEWEDVLAYARVRGARYLVVNDWEITRLRPHLSFLLDPAQVLPELEHLVTLQGPIRRVVIYRIRIAQSGHLLEQEDSRWQEESYGSPLYFVGSLDLVVHRADRRGSSCCLRGFAARGALG
jgi:hypothetical protein